MRINWDEKKYESSFDHGVLYLPDGRGLPWNGLTSINQNLGQVNPEALYFDGIKYLDFATDSDFTATLAAITYPDDFLQFEGVGEVTAGVLADNQMPNRFGLSFRTKTATGYRIHILYNLLAQPADVNYITVSESAALSDFSWTLSGIPQDVPGFKPTEYVILDSEELEEGLLPLFEWMLYGSNEADPYLPPLPVLADVALSWDPKLIVPDPDGIYSIVDGFGDITPSAKAQLYSIMPGSRLKKTSADGVYTLET